MNVLHKHGVRQGFAERRSKEVNSSSWILRRTGRSRTKAPMLGVALLVGLSGCAARYYWSKSGSTPEQFDLDNRQCVHEAMRRTQAGAEVVYRACLEARGYVRAKQVEPPPPGSYRGFEDEDEFPDTPE